MSGDDNGKVEQVRRQRFRKRLFRSLCALGVAVLLVWASSPFIKIGFNATDSVGGYVFLIVKNVEPKKGELAAFWPPENEFYKNIWFVKYIKGGPGDSVSWEGRSVYVNGEYLGDAKPESKNGIKLHPSGSGTIPEGYYFAWTPHKDSFDSRYKQIGPIPKASVFGRAYRIF